MKIKFFIPVICSLALICASATAQPMGGGFGGGMPMGGGMPPMGGGMGMMRGGAIDMAELAEVQTRQLQRELGLNDQQYKKILKINKKELDRRVNHYLSTGGSAGGFGGFGGGMPMGGGMPPMGGGMPPMGGGMPGMGPGGMPGMGAGANAQEDNGESETLKQARNVYDRMEAMEQTKADIKSRIKIEKKMQKILTPEQYELWGRIQARPKGHGGMIEGAALNFDELPEEVRERIRKMMEENGGQFPQGMFPGGAPQGAPQHGPQGGPQHGPQGAPQGMPGGFPQGNPSR